MDTSEKLTGKKLSNEGVKQRGMNWIFHYDNTKRVFERNLPYGATWKDWGVGIPGKTSAAVGNPEAQGKWMPWWTKH